MSEPSRHDGPRDAQAMVDGAPFLRMLGVRVQRFADGEAEMLLPFREDFLVNAENPTIHGGVIAALVDTVGDFALATRVGRGMPTIDMRVDYLRPAGRVDLVGSARVVKLGRTVSVSDVEIRTPGGEVIALGRVLYSTRGQAGG
jgi:uncharacterized protein (TIGR00369 family)